MNPALASILTTIINALPICDADKQQLHDELAAIAVEQPAQ